jgi:hypothetical protein
MTGSIPTEGPGAFGVAVANPFASRWLISRQAYLATRSHFSVHDAFV